MLKQQKQFVIDYPLFKHRLLTLGLSYMACYKVYRITERIFRSINWLHHSLRIKGSNLQTAGMYTKIKAILTPRKGWVYFFRENPTPSPGCPHPDLNLRLLMSFRHSIDWTVGLTKQEGSTFNTSTIKIVN